MEFVLTPVVLTPGACGREGPGGDFLHRFVWIVCIVDWLDLVDPADWSKLGFRLRETLLFPLERPWGVFSGAEKAPAGMGTRTP